MAPGHDIKRLARIGVAAWDARPGLRMGAAVLAALAINLGLLAAFGRLPMRLPPEGGGGAPIEIVFLPAPPEPEAVPDIELAPVVAAPAETPEPEPDPAPRSGPAVPDAELPDARGASGVVALDCREVFDEEGRVVACAGGKITLGYEVDADAWRAIGEALPTYGPERPRAPPGFGEAGFGEADDRYADGRRLDRFGEEGAARLAAADRREAGAPSIIAGGGAEAAAASGADLLAPPSFVTSYGERRLAAEQEEARRDARFRRERIRDLEREE